MSYELTVKTCRWCKKKFVLPGGAEIWAYKAGGQGKRKYFCSWSCLRAAEKDKESGEAARLARKHENISRAAKAMWQRKREAMG